MKRTAVTPTAHYLVTFLVPVHNFLWTCTMLIVIYSLKYMSWYFYVSVRVRWHPDSAESGSRVPRPNGSCWIVYILTDFLPATFAAFSPSSFCRSFCLLFFTSFDFFSDIISVLYQAEDICKVFLNWYTLFYFLTTHYRYILEKVSCDKGLLVWFGFNLHLISRLAPVARPRLIAVYSFPTVFIDVTVSLPN